jgi:hypothetical protein
VWPVVVVDTDKDAEPSLSMTVSFPAPRGKAGEEQESAGRPNTQYLSSEQTIREIIGKESTTYEYVHHFALI